MAGAYAKEFEKWLKGSSNKPAQTFDDGDSVDLEDSNEGVDHLVMVNASKEKDDLAPVLPSSNCGNSGTPQCFQDEPPILEPVQYDPTNFCDNSSISNKCSKDLGIVNIDLEKRKVEILKHSLMHKEESVDKSYYNKSDKSENIFDKFTLLSETDDFPPPLIPSHEAHLTTVDANDDDSPTEKSYATLQNLSPNFCAMEADSTSEMMKGNDNNGKERSGKTAVSSDMGMECDSTCMLSVSPHMVSPGSNIESDNPNTPYSVDLSTEGNPPMPWNSFSSRETYTSLMPFSEQTHLDYGNNFLCADSVNSGGVYHRDGGEWDRECPKLEAVQDVEYVNGALPCMHNANANVEDLHEPPVLSVVPPASLITPKMAARRKRHTIDTVESVSRKHKTYSKDLGSKKLVHMGPSSSKSDKTLVKNDEHQISKSKRKEISVSKNHPRPRKYRERCKTLPIVDLISYGNHLPKDLCDFVVNSSQLSILQNRMHQLVYLLFPQLTAALDSMSPESSQFETLLKDLVHYMEESCPESKSKSECDHETKCPGDEKSTSNSNSNNSNNSKGDTNVDSSKSSDVSVQTTDTDTDVELIPKREGHTEGRQCSRVMDDSACCNKDLFQHSSQTVFSNTSQPDIDSDVNRYKSVIPEFSQLTLNKESERILKRQPSVLIHKNPRTLHRNFCKLSCCTLQLLLPDLNVNLIKEFSYSPKDLLLFIDSVISLNTQR